MLDDPTRVYLTPESFTSGAVPSEDEDVFSLGALACLIFGNQPSASDPAELLQKLRDSATRLLNLLQLADGVPDSIANLVRSSTRSAPAERYSVADFVEQLDRILEDLTRPEHQVTDPREADKGDTLSNGYIVERLLGRGASAIALLVNKGEERRVLKAARDPGFNQRLREEVALLKSLTSPTSSKCMSLASSPTCLGSPSSWRVNARLPVR
jgi:serine/threonine protein kinase